MVDYFAQWTDINYFISVNIIIPVDVVMGAWSVKILHGYSSVALAYVSLTLKEEQRLAISGQSSKDSLFAYWLW